MSIAIKLALSDGKKDSFIYLLGEGEGALLYEPQDGHILSS